MWNINLKSSIFNSFIKEMSAERYPPPPSFRCKKEKLLQFKFLVWMAQCLIMLIEILPHQHYNTNTICSLKGQGQKQKGFVNDQSRNWVLSFVGIFWQPAKEITSLIDTNYEKLFFFQDIFLLLSHFLAVTSKRLFLSSIAKQLLAPADWSSSCFWD